MAQCLKVSDINVYYGAIHAIKGVSFEVNEGEIVTLIGANGAGKTTTLQTVSGLLRSKTGSVEFLGENISHIPAHKIVEKGLAQVPEGRRIFLQMTVQENLDMGAYTASGDIDAAMETVFEQFPRLKERRKQIAQMTVQENLEMGAYTAPGKTAENLDLVFGQFPRLKERRRQAAGTLSGGEQQMLAMGRALMSSPRLMMLDEPSMGLAPILVEQIFEIIRTLHSLGTTILLVEQNAQMALGVADRAYVMETGQITLSGSGRELAASEAIKKAYLGG